MQESLETSLVRIRTADGRVIGAGFLVDERHILTCAHVISQALGLPNTPLDPPQGLVSLDFPLIPPRIILTARVVQWCPPQPDGRGDIAGLELQSDPPAAAEVVQFAPVEDVWEHPFRAFGFPAGYDDGVWATGRLLGRQATDWVMIEDVKPQGFGVVPGFSGTPVWDTQAQGVVGMVVAASRPADTKAAFVIPLDVLVASWALIAVPQGEPRNPYKGLRPFTQKDAGDFFGREPVVEKLVEIVKSVVTEQPASASKRLLTILGPSGSGKSSVVMAGLLPCLQHGALPGSEDWVYLDPIVPGKHPLEALASTLKPHFPDTSFKILREDLEDDAARGLHLLATQLAKQRGTRVVLLIDQFEELFTQTESEDERQRFIRLLLTACSEPRGPLVVLLTLRADLYDRPMQYPDLYRLIETQHLSLLAIEPDDLRRVVEQPAALPDVQVTFEGDLVNRLLADVQGQVGALPLLQFTLDQLFQQRSGRQLTFSAYRELNGVKGALTRQAEKTYTELPSEEHRKLARALFVRLIDPGATEQDTTRRRAALSEFTLAEASQTRLLQEVTDAFITVRLLTTNEIARTTTIEVSHEALIREWPRLASWLREARDDIALQQAISKDTAEWERHNKPGDRLYRGSQLKDAQRWAMRNIPSKNEVAFLRAGAAQRLRYVASVTIIVLLLLSTTGLVGWLLTRPSPPDPTQVTTLNDNGTGSLRWAIDTARAGSTIRFRAGLHGTILLTSADLTFDRNLTIRGPDAGTIAIRGGSSGFGVRVPKGISVSISRLEFEDNNVDCSASTAPVESKCGDSILNEGTLTLADSVISHNIVSSGGDKGIIDNEGGTLSLIRSIVSDNMVDGVDGAGLSSFSGTVNIINSTISHNTCTCLDGGGFGDIGSTIFLTNSTVSENKVDGGDGGGLAFTLSNVILSNSTVSNNTATGNGGGIYDEGSTILLTNSTISNNTATSGGGLFTTPQSSPTFTPTQADLTFCTIYANMASTGSDMMIQGQSNVTIRNSIVVANIAHYRPDITGTITSDGYNLFQDNSGATFDPATRTQHGTDKNLSVDDLSKLFAAPVGLRNNGGPTRTYALGPGSPAIDAIPPQYCQIKGIFNSQFRMYTDQRGMKRPDDDESACDIGAYESSP